MRLSMVFELLLIFLLVAFAAYARVIDRNEATIVHRVLRAAVNAQKQNNVVVSTISLKQATDNVNKYCTCNDNICNCCRDFNIPVVQLKGPGCASVQYLKGDNMALQLSFGDNILTSTVVNGKSPKPVCVPLPGGFSKFCGRIYSIQREAADHFKACLGLELESSDQVEASLRVSCFRFGPDGLKLRPAEPLPVVESDANTDEEDDDDDDIFGLGSDDDDDDDDDEDDDEDEEDDAEDTPVGNAVPSSSADDEEGDEDDDEDDVLGLSSLFDIFGDDDAPSKKPKVTTPAPLPPISIPLLNKPITSDTPIVVEIGEPLVSGNDVPVESSVEEPSKPVTVQEELPSTNGAAEDVTEKVENSSLDSVTDKGTTIDAVEDLVPLGSVIQDNVIQPAASSVQEEYVLKPSKVVNKIKSQSTKKPTVTSSSLNAIENDVKKPVALKPKPTKPDPVKNDAVDSSEEDGEEEEEDEEEDDDVTDDILDDDDDDDDEKEELEEDDEDGDKGEAEAEEEDDDDDDDEEDDDAKKPVSGESEEEEEESVVDDDDDDEEEDLITAIAGDEKEESKVDKISANEAEDPEADDSDYGFGLAEMLARKRNQRHMRPSGRQSKVMRL